MASWVVHLRIGKALLKDLDNIDLIPYIVGNLAPDAGTSNISLLSDTMPSSDRTHFTVQGSKGIDCERFYRTYLLEDADDRLRSFYIGYFTHLMVDRLWSDKIVVPTVQKHQEEFLKNHALLDKVNNDWYALDYYFLKMNPHFSMLEKLKDIQTFKNDYIDFLSDECLEKLIRNVNHLYQNIHAPKDSQMEYLSGEELEKFIEFAIRQITLEMIHKGIMCDGGCV